MVKKYLFGGGMISLGVIEFILLQKITSLPVKKIKPVR